MLLVEYSLRIRHSERACFARDIKSICPDQVLHIRTRFCKLDRLHPPQNGF